MSQSVVAQAAPAAKPQGRAPELEDSLNRYLYHPLAKRVAHLLQPTGISPNAVSVIGGLLVWAAAGFYALVAWPVGALAGFFCHLWWHVFDGADGDLARLTGKSSPIGEFVDGACDYIGHIGLYIVLATILDDSIGAWAWVLAVASGASRIAQSNHAETQRRTYLWRVYGVPWLKTTERQEGTAFEGGSWLSRASEGVTRGYLALAASMSPSSAVLDRMVEHAPAAQVPEVRARIARAWRQPLLLEKALGANARTIILGVSMLAGSPLWFFLVETLVLNGVLAVSVQQHEAAARRLVASAAAAA